MAGHTEINIPIMMLMFLTFNKLRPNPVKTIRIMVIWSSIDLGCMDHRHGVAMAERS